MKNEFSMLMRTATTGAALMASAATGAEPASKPNIVVILADDVGYGDLGCYGATKVDTPNLDRLARNGCMLTDGYAPAAVCTPTRFSMLTGKWAFRQRGTGILAGDAGLCIQPGSVTLPSILKDAGYRTGVVGKWHLGMGRPKADYSVDKVKPGPNEIGFDYSFIFPATNDRVPTIFMENGGVVGYDAKDPLQVSYGKKVGSDPTGRSNPELLKLHTVRQRDHHLGTIVAGVSRIGSMSGGRAARWSDGELTETFAAKSREFIAKNKKRPFFLYVATHTAHEPFVPAARFKGTSRDGDRGDVIHELDWQVGQILDAIDECGISDNTIILFSSDNGAGTVSGKQGSEAFAYDYGNVGGYDYNGKLSGGKASPYEGGTRVPFIVSWPKHIKPGSLSSEIVSLVDLQATFAAAAGVTLPKGAGEDTLNVLPAFLSEGPGREWVIEQHCRGGGHLALRKGDWKLTPRSKGSALLFNLAEDLDEKNDCAEDHPELVQELEALLRKIAKR